MSFNDALLLPQRRWRPPSSSSLPPPPPPSYHSFLLDLNQIDELKEGIRLEEERILRRREGWKKGIGDRQRRRRKSGSEGYDLSGNNKDDYDDDDDDEVANLYLKTTPQKVVFLQTPSLLQKIYLFLPIKDRLLQLRISPFFFNTLKSLPLTIKYSGKDCNNFFRHLRDVNGKVKVKGGKCCEEDIGVIKEIHLGEEGDAVRNEGLSDLCTVRKTERVV
jgi:hypothetical protein